MSSVYHIYFPVKDNTVNVVIHLNIVFQMFSFPQEEHGLGERLGRKKKKIPTG